MTYFDGVMVPEAGVTSVEEDHFFMDELEPDLDGELVECRGDVRWMGYKLPDGV